MNDTFGQERLELDKQEWENAIKDNEREWDEVEELECIEDHIRE